MIAVLEASLLGSSQAVCIQKYLKYPVYPEYPDRVCSLLLRGTNLTLLSRALLVLVLSSTEIESGNNLLLLVFLPDIMALHCR